MRTIKIIELTDEGKGYRVWYDFFKSEVVMPEIEFALIDIKRKKIKKPEVYIVTFNGNEIETVDWVVELWENIPNELMYEYIDNYETVQEFFDDFVDFYQKGYSIDYPFDGGYAIIEHIEEVQKRNHKIIKEGLTYKQAKNELVKNGAIITSPEWKGYHFRFFANYCIRLANGEVIVNPEEIYDKDKNDWMIVDIEDSEMLYAFNKLVEMNIDCTLEEDME